MNGLSHIGLKTTNIERTERFYTTVLGGEVVQRRDVPDRRIWLYVAGVRLEIAELPAWGALTEVQRKALPTVNFAVDTDEVDELAARLDTYGVPRHGPYLKATGAGVGLYFADPDGNPMSFSCAEGYVREGLIRNPISSWPASPYQWPPAPVTAR